MLWLKELNPKTLTDQQNQASIDFCLCKGLQKTTLAVPSCPPGQPFLPPCSTHSWFLCVCFSSFTQHQLFQSFFHHTPTMSSFFTFSGFNFLPFFSAFLYLAIFLSNFPLFTSSKCFFPLIRTASWFNCLLLLLSEHLWCLLPFLWPLSFQFSTFVLLAHFSFPGSFFAFSPPSIALSPHFSTEPSRCCGCWCEAGWQGPAHVPHTGWRRMDLLANNVGYLEVLHDNSDSTSYWYFCSGKQDKIKLFLVI